MISGHRHRNGAEQKDWVSLITHSGLRGKLTSLFRESFQWRWNEVNNGEYMKGKLADLTERRSI